MSGSKAPEVTVITAAYNSRGTLRPTLESLLNQDFTDFESWVIGDACTDDSEGVVRSLGDARLHWKNLDQNSGSQARPNNEGLRLSRGRYIAFLGHDDLWMPTYLSGLVGCIRRSNADFVHSMCALIGPEGVRESMGPPGIGRTYEWHFVPPSAWLHRRELIETCGFWRDPAELRWHVDFDFSRRVFKDGKTIVFHPELSVLKFPSEWFRSYSRTGEPPQAEYMRRVATEPQTLERDVLLKLSTQLARVRHAGPPSVGGALWNLVRAVWRRLCPDGICGAEALSPIGYWYFQSALKKRRARRGLPPKSDARQRQAG